MTKTLSIAVGACALAAAVIYAVPALTADTKPEPLRVSPPAPRALPSAPASMGQVQLTKIHAAILLRYSERPELDPYAVSGKVSLALLEELMATAAIVGRN